MSDILLYISIISAILVVSTLILSVLGVSDTHDVSEIDSGDLGVVKSLLVFLATGAWMTRSMLAIGSSQLSAIGVGLISGAASVYILSKIFSWLLKNQEENVFNAHKYVGSQVVVYLTIKPDRPGIIRVPILGADKDMDAIADVEIATGSMVKIVDYIDGKYVVSAITNS